MQTITEALEKDIPKGPWCHGLINGRARWCKHHEIKKPVVAGNGAIQSNFCHLLEEFVTKKECGINEE